MRETLPGAMYPVSCGPVIRLRLRFKPRAEASESTAASATADQVIERVKQLIQTNSFTEAERAWIVKLASRNALFTPG